MIVINKSEEDLEKLLQFFENSKNSDLRRVRDNLKAKVANIDEGRYLLLIDQAYDQYLRNQHTKKKLEDLQINKADKTIEEIREIINEEIIEKTKSIVKKFGAIEQFKYFGDAYAIQVEEINNLITYVFKIINKVIIDYPDEANIILSGEYTVFESNEIPLIIVVKLLYELSKRINKKLKSETEEFYNHIIEYTETLNYPSSINKDWHISDKVLDNISSADASLGIRKKEYTTSYYTRNSRGELTTDKYPSTIVAYNKLISYDESSEMIAYDLNDDFNKFPELLSTPIWVCRITNRTYKYGSWQLRQCIDTVCLFQEQEDKLRDDYAKLLEYRKAKKINDIKKNVEQFVIPYLEDETFKDFKLIDGLPYDEECFKRLIDNLEQFYNDLENFRKKNGKVSLKDAIEDEEFLKTISFTTSNIVNATVKIKELLASTIVKKYCNKKKITDTKTFYQLNKTFNNLALSKLIACYKKVHSKIFGFSYISKVLEVEA